MGVGCQKRPNWALTMVIKIFTKNVTDYKLQQIKKDKSNITKPWKAITSFLLLNAALHEDLSTLHNTVPTNKMG